MGWLVGFWCGFVGQEVLPDGVATAALQGGFVLSLLMFADKIAIGKHADV